MKQFYYGNVYEENGYKILAQSGGISEAHISKMKYCAEKFTNLSSNNRELMGLVSVKDGFVFFNTVFIDPKIEKNENRPTFFSHQYYIGSNELSQFTSFMPEILLNTKFVKGFSDDYSTEDIRFDISKNYSIHSLPERLCDAAEVAAEGEKHIIIYSSKFDVNTALGFMSSLIESIDVRYRNNISFLISKNTFDDSSIDDIKFIFCHRDNFERLKSRLYKNCFYYDVDSGEIKDSDEKIIINTEPAPRPEIKYPKLHNTNGESIEYGNIYKPRNDYDNSRAEKLQEENYKNKAAYKELRTDYDNAVESNKKLKATITMQKIIIALLVVIIAAIVCLTASKNFMTDNKTSLNKAENIVATTVIQNTTSVTEKSSQQATTEAAQTTTKTSVEIAPADSGDMAKNDSDDNAFLSFVKSKMPEFEALNNQELDKWKIDNASKIKAAPEDIISVYYDGQNTYLWIAKSDIEPEDDENIEVIRASRNGFYILGIVCSNNVINEGYEHRLDCLDDEYENLIMENERGDIK